MYVIEGLPLQGIFHFLSYMCSILNDNVFLTWPMAAFYVDPLGGSGRACTYANGNCFHILRPRHTQAHTHMHVHMHTHT